MSQEEVVRLPNPLQYFLSQVGSLSKKEDNLVMMPEYNYFIADISYYQGKGVRR